MNVIVNPMAREGFVVAAPGRVNLIGEHIDYHGLPDVEQFVGTRGGGMDHAASLASRAGCASLIGFNPVTIRHIPIPAGWGFLVANSMVRAEKSGSAREEYNARRNATMTAREKIA